MKAGLPTGEIGGDTRGRLEIEETGDMRQVRGEKGKSVWKNVSETVLYEIVHDGIQRKLLHGWNWTVVRLI